MLENVRNGGAPDGKPLIFILYHEKRLPEAYYHKLEDIYRPIEYKGPAHLFENSEYYTSEFGEGLYRHVIAFEGLMDPVELPSLKQLMYTVEQEYSIKGNRTVNLDIGYLDPDKLVLASYKRGKYKMYLGNGIYGDMLMEYAKGLFKPLPWAFQDFAKGIYNQDLIVIREKLKSALRKNKV